MAFSRSLTTLASAVTVAGAAAGEANVTVALRGAADGRAAAVAGSTAEAGSRMLSDDTQYDHYFDKNAFSPYGATDIDSDATAPSGLTPQQCEDRCTADANCMCVTQDRATGKCWKRANCEPSQWTSQYNAGHNVYMKRGASPGPDASWFELRFYSNQDKCLDVKDHQTYNGNIVQLWDCFSSDNDQYWTAGDMNANINGAVKWATHQEKCLDVKDHETASGTPLQIWECIASDFDQQFYFDGSAPPAGSGSIPRPVGRLRWKDHPSKCVVAKDGGDRNGNTIVLTDCVDGQTDQYWVNDYVER